MSEFSTCRLPGAALKLCSVVAEATVPFLRSAYYDAEMSRAVAGLVMMRARTCQPQAGNT
jgi:hypothetical protein